MLTDEMESTFMNALATSSFSEAIRLPLSLILGCPWVWYLVCQTNNHRRLIFSIVNIHIWLISSKITFCRNYNWLHCTRYISWRTVSNDFLLNTYYPRIRWGMRPHARSWDGVNIHECTCRLVIFWGNSRPTLTPFCARTWIRYFFLRRIIIPEQSSSSMHGHIWVRYGFRVGGAE